jgi:hypothetical protein
MTTTDRKDDLLIREKQLTGRLSKVQIIYLANRLHQDEKGILEVLEIVLQQADGHTAMNAAWLLSHLQKDDKVAYLCPQRDVLTDFAMRKDIKMRRGLILSTLLDLPDAEPRVDFLDYCMEEFANEQQSDSCRSTMIKLAQRQCAPYPELQEELRQRLLLLPPGLPPSISSARRKALKALPHR